MLHRHKINIIIAFFSFTKKTRFWSKTVALKLSGGGDKFRSLNCGERAVEFKILRGRCILGWKKGSTNYIEGFLRPHHLILME